MIKKSLDELNEDVDALEDDYISKTGENVLPEGAEYLTLTAEGADNPSLHLVGDRGTITNTVGAVKFFNRDGNEETPLQVGNLECSGDGVLAFGGDFILNGDFTSNHLAYENSMGLAEDYDLDTLTLSGFYVVNITDQPTANSPIGQIGWGYVIHQEHSTDNGYSLQTFVDFGQGVWTRTRNNYIWGTWKQVYDETSLTKTVIDDLEVDAGSIGGVVAANLPVLNDENLFVFIDNVCDTAYSGIYLDHNLSGSDPVVGADRVHSALRIDSDSSATGGGLDDEHRVYGIYNTVDITGDSDLVANYYGTAKAVQTTGTITNLKGISVLAGAYHTGGTVGTAVAVEALVYEQYAGGSTTNVVGLNAKTNKYATNTSTTASHKAVNAITTVAEGSGAIDSVRVVSASFDNNWTTNQENAAGVCYLFYGDYLGVAPTDAYGLYIPDNVHNLLGGDLIVESDLTATTGDTTLGYTTVSRLFLESGKHAITTNDGGGNFNIRVGSTAEASPTCTEDGYVAHIEFTQSTGVWNFDISQTTLVVDDAVLYYTPLKVDPAAVTIGATGDARLIATNETTLHGQVTINDDIIMNNTSITGVESITFDSLLDGGTQATSFTYYPSKGQYQEFTMSGDVTLVYVKPSGPTTTYLHVHQSGAGNTLTLPATMLWKNGTAQSNTKTDGAHDILMIHYFGDGTTSEFVAEYMLDIS